MSFIKKSCIVLIILLTACSLKQETKDVINENDIIRESVFEKTNDFSTIEDLLNKILEEQKKTNELIKENTEAINTLLQELITSDKEVIVVEIPKTITQIIEKDKEENIKEEKKAFILTEETLFESGSIISFEVFEDKTYVYKIKLYNEPLFMIFNNGVDLSTISIELYESDEISTIYLEKEENTIYCDEELDGIYYLVLNDLPQGTYEINIGY